MGYALRGSDLIVNKLALVQLNQEGSGQTITYFGLFSPAQSAYEVEVAGTGLLSSIAPYYDPWTGAPTTPNEITFVQSDPGVVRGLSINQWSMQAFQSESFQQDVGSFETDLTISREGISGTVRNGTSALIQDAVLVMGTRYTDIGDLAPGETAEVMLALPEETGFRYSGEIGWILFEEVYSGSVRPAREVEVKRSMVNAVFQNGGGAPWSSLSMSGNNYSQQPVLLGWLDSAPPEVRVNDQTVTEQGTTLVYQPVDYRFLEGSEIWLPVGTIPGGLVEYPFEGGNCGPDNTSVWLGRGEAVFAYQLPENVQDVTPEALRLSIRSDGGWVQLPEVSIYHWGEDRWVGLEGVVTGVNVIGNADRFVDESGNIKVKLATEVNTGGGCLFVEVGLQGTRQES
jgi:hypothetical protein